MSTLPIFILSFLFSVACCFERLIFAETYFRHGDRTPVQPLRTGRFNASFYGNQLGELTPLGTRQGYLLGKKMKKRYVTNLALLDENFLNLKEIYVRSTDVNRTLMTANAFTAGMFDYGKRGRDFPDSPDWIPNWTPIPVHTAAMSTDYEGNPFPLCPRATELDQMQLQSQSFRNLVRDHEDFVASLERFCGEKITVRDSLTVYGLLDALMILKKHNLTLPEWATPAVVERLNTISDGQLMLKFGQTGEFGNNIIRLRGGSKAKTILSRLQDKWNCFLAKNETRACLWYGRLKFHAFATHDMTLWGMLTPFGIVEKVFGKHHEIDHAASVTFELWNADGKPMLNVVFLKNPGLNEEFQSVTHLIEGCPQDRKFCPLLTVVAATQKFFPGDLAEECKPKNPKVTKRSLDGRRREVAFFDGLVW
ncbi:hypothetical protein QR680_005843 [Steinernema hermaphroditum]|uniref:Histidine acid phosphatase n=1 Tax=Steinernema hermaphroditum TaxID=289476 RepID=A0AA39LW46_9BILA|nr:hypothetical protein QR680_005843 [Steinernema hermaphroditum]